MGDRMHCQTQDIVVAGLGKDLGDMPLDRPFAEIELLGYLLSGLRLADQTQDIYLDLGQLHTVGDDALPGERKRRVSLHGRADDSKEFACPNVLVDEAVHTGLAGTLDKGDFRKPGHHHHFHARQLALDQACRHDAARVVLGTDIEKRAGSPGPLRHSKRIGSI